MNQPGAGGSLPAGQCRFDPSSGRDVDVVFLDPTDLTRDNGDRATARMDAVELQLQQVQP
ncbi:hypothetical protein [Micromonospora sp. DT233]|uniref:hypothetical protein n=1 Tax=Micromonospora sp. DT233 TaxID=3393432 RepID=UPI003CE94AD3